MPKKIDPLNRKQYSAVTASLVVTDVKAALNFYQKALGFAKRNVMNGPDGKPMHAELALRGTTLMLSPESAERGFRSAKTIGASPVGLYVYAEDADKAVAKAVKFGGTAKGPVMDMFWGDRAGTIVDPEGYTWMIATHKAEPTPAQMKKAMAEQMKAQAAAATNSGT
jgi:PhnB protein